MANPYYAPGGQRAEKVEDLFAGIAGRYDLLNDLQSFGLHRRFTGDTSLVMFGGGMKRGFVCGATADERPLVPEDDVRHRGPAVPSDRGSPSQTGARTGRVVPPTSLVQCRHLR